MSLYFTEVGIYVDIVYNKMVLMSFYETLLSIRCIELKKLNSFLKFRTIIMHTLLRDDV